MHHLRFCILKKIDEKNVREIFSIFIKSTFNKKDTKQFVEIVASMSLGVCNPLI